MSNLAGGTFSENSMEISSLDIDTIRNKYTQRDLAMILLGAKICSEILAQEYDETTIVKTLISDLLKISDLKDYSIEHLEEILNKNLTP